jgi:hypothetical protein
VCLLLCEHDMVRMKHRVTFGSWFISICGRHYDLKIYKGHSAAAAIGMQARSVALTYRLDLDFLLLNLKSRSHGWELSSAACMAPH